MSFTIEAWTYLAICIVIVAGRVAARLHITGWRNVSPDDILMVVALLLYTAETAIAHYVGAWWLGLANSGMTDAERAAVSPQSREYHLRVKESQTQLFGWVTYTSLMWMLKLSWLFFYRRLGEGVDRMALKINVGFVFVGATYVAGMLSILFGCFPIEKNWQIFPNPGVKLPAVFKMPALLVMTTNVATDFYIMSIPLPMVWSARISPGKKTGLLFMFCGGLITAVFGGLRTAYILRDNGHGPLLAGEWSCRESFVAVFISNVPVLFPFMNRAFRRYRYGFSGGGGKKSTPMGGAGAAGGPYAARGGGALYGTKITGGNGFKLSTISGKGTGTGRGGGNKTSKYRHPLSLPGDTFYDRFGSEEEIVDSGSGGDDKKKDSAEREAREVKGNDNIHVQVTTEWRVQSQEIDAEGLERDRKEWVTAGYHAQ
ncbi:hypothetical protein GE09DRAFT_1243211 [Coniochaeta sp. 2T2.1]|nr:hypothetical protein GE09DRAFT_1243211 [Coniochaeta sp. 2T2.1]